MRRRPTGLRQHYAVIKHSIWPRLDIKKLALACTALAITIGGAALLSLEPHPGQTKPRTITPASDNPSTHPLLGADYLSNTLPGQQNHQSDPDFTHQNDASDSTTNGVIRQTTVTVNGESIAIPPTGSSRQTIKNQDGSITEVDILHEQTSVEGMPRSNIIIDSRSQSNSKSSSINSRITITH